MNIQDLLPQVRKVVASGPNFRAFRKEKGLEHTDRLTLSLKSPDSLVVTDHIYLSEQITEFICEVEMAVVIGKTADRISEAEAPAYIAGYAIANDITASDHWESGRFKMFDQTTPIGEIVQVEDPGNVTLEMWVNGELIQRDNTADMLFSANGLVSHISHVMTLRPGDIILTGTPANPRICSIGDVVEMRSPELGTIRHTIHRLPATRERIAGE